MDMVKAIILILFPKIFYYLNIQFMNKEATEFIANIMKKSIKDRQMSKEKKDDFIDMLVQVTSNASWYK